MNRFKRLPITRANQQKPGTAAPAHSGSEVANSTGRTGSTVHSSDFGAAVLQRSIEKSYAVAVAGMQWGGAGSLGGFAGSLTQAETTAWGESFNSKIEAPSTFDATQFKEVKLKKRDGEEE